MPNAKEFDQLSVFPWGTGRNVSVESGLVRSVFWEHGLPLYHVFFLFGVVSLRKCLPQFLKQLHPIQIFEAYLEFVKKALRIIGRHYTVPYGKWILDGGTWSEFLPQAGGGASERSSRQNAIF